MTKEHQDRSALFVMDGVKGGHDGMSYSNPKKFRKKKQETLDIKKLAEEVRAGDRTSLAKAITLIESSNNAHKEDAQKLLQELLPYTGNCIRIGITGVPGAGKSSFIEAFGTMLCKMGKRVAVLAIDPSSSLSGGSILGDKTRMEELVRQENAFVRPSPSAGTLGGVHKKSRETMLLCEAAGYDVLLIETVGVGQSETYVRGMVDFFLLLVLTGAGDELQGMKKGIMELADGIVVHKADGDNVRPAKRTMQEYKQILHFLQPATPGWMSTALTVSSLEKTGLENVWTMLMEFEQSVKSSNYWAIRRREQTRDWFHSMITDHLIDSFYQNEERKMQVRSLETDILKGSLTVTQGVNALFDEKETHEL
ncbi:methylmalonyl Co-A mutase-associated GTPase MeaB [Lysinibacillus sp. 2017]|uniref:methylmalonyl Co-A mutase-associated GTPase MeaB n=1 Tax=unclassified Lysinibacillus TaxID=2636778 RepID=UPI000D526511|nr:MULTISPECIES: methylmalonyl Co-A mutase-associated GTPase MeaB [unclassified Lysinibacillus]AWE07871.1 methylmalonyl Co-A mutase-associated GTPase MeaB [Lysinibacillus sp. 2017]TGN31836.1 methylmalonyl Co-A mutase-associated GTPase MeaB [Lysinibacillus sp. S2017]